jgi:hypothetical protein
MAVAIKKIPNYLDPNFKKECIGVFNKRWAQFDIKIYLVALFLHPNYRGQFNYFIHFICNIFYLSYCRL